MEELAIITLATSAISLTLSKSKMFEPVRGRLTGIWHDLASCHYCISHWIAMVLVALTQPAIGKFFRWPQLFLIDWFIMTMAVVAVAAMVSSVIIYGMRSSGQ